MKIVNESIRSATICYGGVNPQFVHAAKTEEFLRNKNVYSSEVLQDTFVTLNSDIQANWNPPQASPSYRKGLCLALFYKFILKSSVRSKLKPTNTSGGNILERPLSSGIQSFETNKEEWPLTQPVLKIGGIFQTSGEAFFTNDLPKL